MEFSPWTVGLATGVSCGICIGYFLRARLSSPLASLTATSMNGKVTIEQIYDHFTSSNMKLVLVVREDLKMGKGKAAAQCAHAAVIAYRQLLKHHPKVLQKWESCGQTKVVLKIKDEESMMNLVKEAKRVGLLTSLVCDAGRTQVASGSKTVLGVGPGPEELISQVTGHLKLY